MKLKTLFLATTLAAVAPFAMAQTMMYIDPVVVTPIVQAPSMYTQSAAQAAEYGKALAAAVLQLLNLADQRAQLIDRIAALRDTVQRNANNPLAQAKASRELEALLPQLTALTAQYNNAAGAAQGLAAKLQQVQVPADVQAQLTVVIQKLTDVQSLLKVTSAKYEVLSVTIQKLTSVLATLNPASPQYAQVKQDLANAQATRDWVKSQISMQQNNIQVFVTAKTELARLTLVPAVKEIATYKMPGALSGVLKAQDQHSQLLTQINALSYQLTLTKDPSKYAAVKSQLASLLSVDQQARAAYDATRSSLKEIGARAATLAQ